MADPVFNAVAFNPSVSIFGKLAGDVTITPGLTPSIVQLLVPRSQFMIMHPTYRGVGDLEFYYKNDPGATPDFVLEDWLLYYQLPTQWGKIAGQNSYDVIERQFTLVDSRRNYRNGRGGLVTVGLYNPSRKDGQTDRLANGQPKLSMHDAMLECLASMDLAALGAQIPVGMADIEAPRDLKWDAQHAPTELGKLLDAAGLVFCLDAAGNPKIFEIDPGVQPDIPADAAPDALPFEQTNAPEDLPDLVLVTSAPNYAIEQISIIGPNPQTIDFVGIDTDGSKMALSQLTYVNNDLTVLAKLLQGHTGNLTPAQITAAYASSYQWMMLAQGNVNGEPNPNKARLPILSRIADVVAADPQGANIPILQAPRLEAKMRYQENGLWKNSTSFIDVPFMRVDAAAGLIIAAFPIGKVNPSPASGTFAGFTPLVDGELRFTFAFERRGQANWWERFYTSAWQLDDAGNAVQLTGPQLASAAANTQAYVIPAPQLRLFYKDGAAINQAPLDAAARVLAENVLTKGTRQVTTRRFRGFHPFECNGQISKVTIAQESLMTTIEVNQHYLGGSKLLEERTIKPLREAAIKAQRNEQENEQSRNDTRDFAAVESDGRQRPKAPQQFWIVIDGHINSVPPYEYDWHEVLETNQAGPHTSTSQGMTRMVNRGEDRGRLDPDGTSTNVVYPAIKIGTRLRCQGYDAIAGRWYFDATLQPRRGPC